jgi:copper chaperone CopZ
MKHLFFIISLISTQLLFAQTKDPNETGKAIIMTSAECGSCKTRIEGVLNYTKGVKFAELNVLEKTVVVEFNPKKITVEEIRKIISETGYDADKVKANAKSQSELPKCCKPGGMK